MGRFFALWVLVLASTLLSGCPPTTGQSCESDADCPDGRCRFGACGPVCEEDLDCGSRQICQDGACAPRPECAQDSDCATGFSCDEGTCRCASDASCALNQTCVAGVCQTRVRCQSDTDCTANQRCELTQGLCLPPCAFSTDCAPGLDPQLAVALYQCFQGTCFRRCVNDVTCGTGLICSDGLCAASQCSTMADCPQGQYCTSENFGRCRAFETCSTTAECDPNFECRAFPPMQCPPGFPCGTTICQELPRCLLDQDCAGGLPGQPATPAYCRDSHCQPSTSCATSAECAQGQLCVAEICVPGGCRGHADCPTAQACVGGACRSAPNAIDVASLSLTPSATHLEVGETVKFQLIGYELDGSSFPLPAATFEVLDQAGQPTSAATVTSAGEVTGVSPGRFMLRASLQGAAVQPVSAALFVHAQVTSGRRVVVTDSTNGAALAGVTVIGCDAPSSSGPCAAPVEVSTDPLGEASFPSFTGVSASFSIASPELRADGLPRYERVSIVDTGASSLLIPLSPNPVQAAAGINGVISFTQVRSQGNYWLGFSVLSASDPSDVALGTLLGETFQVSVPGVPQQVPVPGSVVLYTSPGLGIPNEIKGRSLPLGQPGRRAAVAFAGRTTTDQAITVRSTDFLAYAGAFDFGVVPFLALNALPRVMDAMDVDNDGLCVDPMLCPLGPELVPNYAAFQQPSFTPRYEQSRRTEVVLPELPEGFDTAVAVAVEATPDMGLVPLGFTSRVNPTGPLLLRSGAPLAGIEVGQPGLWVMALQAGAAGATDGGNVSARLSRSPTLPTRQVVAPFLALPENSTWTPSTRLFAPGQPAWNTAVSSGAELARVDLLGTEGRHRVYFVPSGSQTGIRIPDAPAVGGADPVSEVGASLQVTLIDLASGVSTTDALDLAGPGLDRPSMLIDGYSRWQAP